MLILKIVISKIVVSVVIAVSGLLPVNLPMTGSDPMQTTNTSAHNLSAYAPNVDLSGLFSVKHN